MDNPFDRETYNTFAPDWLVIGQFVGWKLDYDYSDIDFSLRYALHPLKATNNTNDIVITGSRVALTDESVWVFEVDSATSNGYGVAADTEYRWDLILTQVSTGNETSIRSGFIHMFTSSSDRRSHAEIMLSQINALLEGRALSDVSSYSIKSRSLTRLGIDELIQWRDYYANEVKRTGGTSNTGKKRIKSNTVQVGFN